MRASKPGGIIGPDGFDAVSVTPAFPLVIDLRWGPGDDGLCRMMFSLDGSVSGDPARLRTWLTKATNDVNPGILLQWWLVLAMLEANPAPADVSVGGGDPDAPERQMN